MLSGDLHTSHHCPVSHTKVMHLSPQVALFSKFITGNYYSQVLCFLFLKWCIKLEPCIVQYFFKKNVIWSFLMHEKKVILIHFGRDILGVWNPNSCRSSLQHHFYHISYKIFGMLSVFHISRDQEGILGRIGPRKISSMMIIWNSLKSFEIYFRVQVLVIFVTYQVVSLTVSHTLFL